MGNVWSAPSVEVDPKNGSIAKAAYPGTVLIQAVISSTLDTKLTLPQTIAQVYCHVPDLKEAVSEPHYTMGNASSLKRIADMSCRKDEKIEPGMDYLSRS